MPSLMNIGLFSNRVFLGNPEKTADSLISLLKSDCDIFVLPPYCVSGNLKDLFCNDSFILKTKKASLGVAKSAKAPVIMGGCDDNGKACCYIFSEGEIIDTVYLGKYSIFDLNNIRTCLYLKGAERLAFDLAALEQEGIDLLLVCDYTSMKATTERDINHILATASRSLGTHLLYLNGGVGDTSAPDFYKGVISEYSFGDRIHYEESAFDALCHESVIDASIIKGYKRCHNLPLAEKEVLKLEFKTAKDTYVSVLKDPYTYSKPADFLNEVFELQASSLAVRMRNINVTKAVIGVSGGLDSTLALLVCKKAMEMLGLPSENIIAVTMQGFGTSDKTYENALALMQKLGTTIKEIPIKNSVICHFEDIGHDLENRNVTYENAQARERTQILLDIANEVGGIVVGTGDLSESALGFCTFAGDHISNFNVNICITKTMMRKIIDNLIAELMFENCNELLRDILDTPVSPELLPTDHNGEISQKTEEILGSYELHDFFLYYLVRYGAEESTIEFYAKNAFTHIPDAKIEKALKLFMKKFIASRFKRACAPEAANITEINLLSNNFPSDLSI